MNQIQTFQKLVQTYCTDEVTDVLCIEMGYESEQATNQPPRYLCPRFRIVEFSPVEESKKKTQTQCFVSEFVSNLCNYLIIKLNCGE